MSTNDVEVSVQAHYHRIMITRTRPNGKLQVRCLRYTEWRGQVIREWAQAHGLVAGACGYTFRPAEMWKPQPHYSETAAQRGSQRRAAQSAARKRACFC